MRYALALLLTCTVATLGVATRGAPAAIQPLKEAAGSQQTPTIVSNGTTFLLAWTDEGRDMRRQVAPAGTPPPPPPSPTPPRAALVTARVSSTGQVRDAGGVEVSQAANRISEPKLASGGATSLAVWSDYSAEASLAAIYGARLSPANAVVGAAPIPISIRQVGGYKANPDVAFDGRNYLVVWQDYVNGQGLKIFGARVSTDGTVLDTAPITIADGGAEPAIAFDGTNYMVAWWEYGFEGRTVFVTRVSPAGAVIDPGGIAVGAEGYVVPTPAIGFNGTSYLVAWPGKEGPIGSHELTAARVSPAGVVLDPNGIEIARHADEFFQPAVGSDRNNFLVVWKHDRSPCCFISGARVSPGGGLLDSPALTITSPSDGNGQADPTVAFNGSSYLVAWTDNRTFASDIYGARVRPDGVNLDPRGILLSTAAGPPPPRPRCIVPRVIGLRLARAKTRVRRANCSLGPVRRRQSARGPVVLSQKPRARAIRKRGWPVTLVVGRR